MVGMDGEIQGGAPESQEADSPRAQVPEPFEAEAHGHSSEPSHANDLHISPDDLFSGFTLQEAPPNPSYDEEASSREEYGGEAFSDEAQSEIEFVDQVQNEWIAPSVSQGEEDSSEHLDSFFNPVDSEQSDSSDSIDVSSFAQSEASAANEGVLLYDLAICCRTADSDWEDLFSILQDPRFRVNVDELKKSVENNCLVIKNFGPAKAAVLLNRLNLTEYDVTWKQKHLFKSEEF